jgi:signal transduction histidine kinase
MGAVEASWDEQLAGAFSGRLREVKKELVKIPALLENLPNIPLDDQGGTGGFASIHPNAVPTGNNLYAIEVRWPAQALISMVALVPARRYDAKGLDAHYGIPDEFTIELMDADGKCIRTIARENNARQNPVRLGHPFVYQVSPPVAASGLRISARLLHPDSENEKNHVHAWAEVFAYEGEKNIARGAKVASIGGSAPPAPWHWKPEFLVDEQTPLGLPEIPAEHHNVGWLSNGRESANEKASLTVDLGEIVEVDGVRLLPARRPTSDLPSGFGFPKKIVISVSDTGEPGDDGKWKIVAEREFRNPGHNPVLVTFDAFQGRHVRIEATELWKDFESYPAFFALSEVEVLNHAKNLAQGKVVRSSDGMLNIIGPGGNYWSGASLSDGFGPDGRLVSSREWMTQLDQRLHLETRRHDLQLEATNLVKGWRNLGLSIFVILGLAGAIAIIALPIRYRIHSHHQLLKVRERIAGDLHDEVGSNLGSIQMFADLAAGRSGPSEDLKRIQRIASETVSAVRDIVWLLRPGGDHRIGAVEHLRETSSIMLETLKWKFSANEESWQLEFPEETNRHLFLFFREALHNILRHAQAAHVDVRVETDENKFLLTIKDDGVGIDPERFQRPATLRALRQRAEALNAEFLVESNPGSGTQLTLNLPLGKKRPRKYEIPEKS